MSTIDLTTVFLKFLKYRNFKKAAVLANNTTARNFIINDLQSQVDYCIKNGLVSDIYKQHLNIISVLEEANILPESLARCMCYIWMAPLTKDQKHPKVVIESNK